MPQFKRLTLAALVAGLIAPSAQATNGYFSHGYGTANKALGGGAIALPQDALAAASSPAGMVWVGDRMDMGAALFSPRRKFDVKGNPSQFPGTFPLEPGTTKSNSNWFLIPHFGYNHMLDSESSVGISLYGNGGMNVDYDNDTSSVRALPDGMGGFSPCHGVFCAGTSGQDMSQLFANLNYSRRFLNDKTSWGVSVIGVVQRIKVKGISTFAGFTKRGAEAGQAAAFAVLGAGGSMQDAQNAYNGTAAATANKLSNNGYDYAYGGGFKFGLQSEVMPGLTLAGSYQTKMWMGDWNDYQDLFAQGGGFDIPPTATAGLAWNFIPKHTLTFDVQYIDYSDTASISNKNKLSTRCNAFSPSFDSSYCLGGSNGAGFGWDSMTIYKLGYQYDHSPNWSYRAGVSYADQPIPDSEVLFNTLAPATIEWHITAGLTHKLSKKNRLSLALMYAPEKKVSGSNAFEAPGQQDIEIKMYQFEVEASFGFVWD